MENTKVDQMASKVVDLPQLSLEEIFLELDDNLHWQIESQWQSNSVFQCQIASYNQYYDQTVAFPSPSSSPDLAYGHVSPCSSPIGYSKGVPSEDGYISRLVSSAWEPKMKKSYHKCPTGPISRRSPSSRSRTITTEIIDASTYAVYESSQNMTLEETDKIRIEFKQKRIRLGLSQKQAAESVSKTVRKTSQTSLCRFENNQLHKKNMISLAPHLKKWIQLN